MVHSEAKSSTYAAIKERGILYLETYRELKIRYGQAEAVNVMRSISHAQGVGVGKTMAKHAPGDFEGLCKCWVLAPDDGTIFQPDIRRMDEDGIEVKMMACPLKDAWIEAGCSEDEICTLLYCASAYDYAALETAGFTLDLELWSPGKDGCCLSKISTNRG